MVKTERLKAAVEKLKVETAKLEEVTERLKRAYDRHIKNKPPSYKGITPLW